jgi:hypothetical protein
VRHRTLKRSRCPSAIFGCCDCSGRVAWAPCGWPINSSLSSNTPLDRAGLLCEVDDAEAAFADNRENLEWSDGVANLGPNTRWPFTTDRYCRLLFIWGKRGAQVSSHAPYPLNCCGEILPKCSKQSFNPHDVFGRSTIGHDVCPYSLERGVDYGDLGAFRTANCAVNKSCFTRSGSSQRGIQ